MPFGSEYFCIWLHVHVSWGIACRKDGMAGQRVEPSLANVSMIHHVPELIVSDEVCCDLSHFMLFSALKSYQWQCYISHF